ncbi:GTP cyclohydrolase 1 type 2 [Planctomycetes bacterium MalM25]|nr:GTP cyclohydrolase 1 type 2 [Planctomycetes bacterium MalM25]
MPTLADAVTLLQQIAPPELAEDWDNVGLLAGDPAAPLRRVHTCLTLTPDVVDEAITAKADLVVSHHPLPFRGVKTLTTGTIDGGSLWRLLGAGVAVYSPHTAYDSAADGVNAQWAERLPLADPRPLEPIENRDDGAGVGRIGLWNGGGFDSLVEAVKSAVNLPEARTVKSEREGPLRVAVACGSGGSLLDLAIAAGCDAFLTGEMTFHDCLRCRSLGMGAILTGHYASERFAIETLADRLAEGLPGVEVAASAAEADPLTVS